MKRQILNPTPIDVRRGTILVEAIVAAIILGAAISMLVPAMTAVRHQRQSHRFESLAMVELNNIAEFLPSPSELIGDSAKKPALSAWFTSRYARASLDLEVLPKSTVDGAKSLQPVRLTIRRPIFEKMPEQKVSIVVWKIVEEPTP